MKPNISDNTGKGNDRKGTKRDGLRFTWKWVKQCGLSGADRNDHRRLPCQTCSAEVGDFTFEATDWHDRYEATVDYNNKAFLHGSYFPTRLQAQLHAETMILEWCKATLTSFQQ